MATLNSSPRRTSAVSPNGAGLVRTSSLEAPSRLLGSRSFKSRFGGEHFSTMRWLLNQRVLFGTLLLGLASYVSLYFLAGGSSMLLRAACRYPDVEEIRQHQQQASLYQQTWIAETFNSSIQALVTNAAGLDSLCLSVRTGQREEAVPKHRLIRFLRDAKGMASRGQNAKRRPLYMITDVPELACHIAATEFGSLEMCLRAGDQVHEKAFRELPCHVHVSIPGVMFLGDTQLRDRLPPAENNAIDASGYDPVKSNTAALVQETKRSLIDRTNDGLILEQLPPIVHVCVSVTIGDDSDMPNEQALPYGKVLRLLRRAREIAAENPSEVEKRIHVGVDFPTIVCRMVHDELAKGEYTCETYRSGGKHKEAILCDVLVVGASAQYTRQDPAAIVGKHRWPWLARPLEWVDLDKDEVVVPQIRSIRRTLLTSVSDDHFEAVFRFIRSVDFFCPPGICNWDLVVYDMVLMPVLRKRLDCLASQMKSVKVEIRTWDFSKWPLWMDLRTNWGEYAWKAPMVKEILDATGNALWMDGGNRVTSVESLLAVFDKYENRLGGFYCPGHSGGVVKDWTHLDEIKYLRAGEHLEDLNCNAAVIGFTMETYKTIFWDWFECSIIRQCIAPEGSSRQNHRQDQAALTLIAALRGNPCLDPTEVPIHWDSTEYNENVTATTC